MLKNKTLRNEIISLLNERTRIFDEQLKGLRWTEIRNALLFSHQEWNISQFNMKLTRVLDALQIEGDIEKEIISSKHVCYRISKTFIKRNSSPEKKGIYGISLGLDSVVIDPSWGPSEEDYLKFKKRHLDNLIEKIREIAETISYSDKELRRQWEDYWKHLNENSKNKTI